MSDCLKDVAWQGRTVWTGIRKNFYGGDVAYLTDLGGHILKKAPDASATLIQIIRLG
jgi:hypothetical protein